MPITALLAMQNLRQSAIITPSTTATNIAVPVPLMLAIASAKV